MEEEIDLRPYIEVLIKNWKWIIGAGVLTALVALGISSLLPSTYEAAALVVISEPGDILEFDARIRSANEDQPLNAFPELATGDEVLVELLTQLPPSIEDINSLESLRDIIESEAGSDPSLIHLSVRYEDAVASSELTNKWAELFTAKANEIYGAQGGDQLRFFEGQLVQAESELQEAEDAIVAFQAVNRLSIVTNRWESYNNTQADYLAVQQDLIFLIQNVQGLRDQLLAQPRDAGVTFAEQLTLLSLQLQAFDAQTPELQLQLDTNETFVSVTLDDQLVFLDNLLASLESKSRQVGENLSQLEPQILDLQRQKQEIEIESSRRLHDLEVAQDTYTALARKVEEERIASQDTKRGVRLASKAAVPEKPVSPRILLNTAVAGILGLMLCVFGIISYTWWRQFGIEEGSSSRSQVISHSDRQFTRPVEEAR